MRLISPENRQRWRSWSPWRRGGARLLVAAFLCALALALHGVWSHSGYIALLAIFVLPYAGDYSGEILERWRARRARRRARQLGGDS